MILLIPAPPRIEGVVVISRVCFRLCDFTNEDSTEEGHTRRGLSLSLAGKKEKEKRRGWGVKTEGMLLTDLEESGFSLWTLSNIFPSLFSSCLSSDPW